MRLKSVGMKVHQMKAKKRTEFCNKFTFPSIISFEPNSNPRKNSRQENQMWLRESSQQNTQLRKE